MTWPRYWSLPSSPVPSVASLKVISVGVIRRAAVPSFMSHAFHQIQGRVSTKVANGSKTNSCNGCNKFFICVSLGSSTVQLDDRLGGRHACACSEAGFSTQNGNRARGVYDPIGAFFVGKGTQCKG
jgi:hypothetical protein